MNMETPETPTMELVMGERVTLMFLLNNFDGEHTSSIMRKTRRVKHALAYRDIHEGASINQLLTEAGTLAVGLDKETLGWLWDIFGKFNKWPTPLDEWVESLEDKLRAAVAVGK
jgi:hypothetical protein